MASFNKHRPCPNCKGYGSGRKTKRCRGFFTRNGEGFFCELPNDKKPINPLGFDLYFYRRD